MLFLHANGFNGLTYHSLLGPLAEQRGVHIMALDLRGHGQSTGFENRPKTLRNFSLLADDVVQLLEQYIERPLLICGHSLGAVVGMLAARQIGGKMSGYLGFDPVAVPAIIRFLPMLPGGTKLFINSFSWAKAAGRRRVEFDDLDDAFAYHNVRGTFKFLPDEVVRDYLTGGTVENNAAQRAGENNAVQLAGENNAAQAVEGKNGAGIKLSCDPLWEQAIYGAQANDIFGAAKSLPQNSRIMFAGKRPASTRFTRAKMARILGKNSQGEDKVSFRADYSHFFPLTEQEDTRKLISARF